MSNVPAAASTAGGTVVEIESDQDKNNDIIVIVTKQKTFYVPRNVAAADCRLRAHAEQHRLQWSVDETCKFASAEVVPSKI